MLLRNITQRSATNLPQPEEEAANVSVPSEIAEVLRGHKRTVVFGVDESAIVDRVGLDIVINNPVQDHSSPTLLVLNDQRITLRGQVGAAVTLDVRQQGINKLWAVETTRIFARELRS